MPTTESFALVNAPGWGKVAFHISHLIHDGHLHIAVNVPNWIAPLCNSGKALMLVLERRGGQSTKLQALACLLRCARGDLPEAERERVTAESVLICFFAMEATWCRDGQDSATASLREAVEDERQEGEAILWWHEKSTIIDRRLTLDEGLSIAGNFVAATNARFRQTRGREFDLRNPDDYRLLDWAEMVRIGRELHAASNLGHVLIGDYVRRQDWCQALGAHADDAVTAFFGLTHYVHNQTEYERQYTALLRLKAAVKSGELTLEALTKFVRNLLALIDPLCAAFNEGTTQLELPSHVSPTYWTGIFFLQPAMNWWEVALHHLERALAESRWFNEYEAHLRESAEQPSHPRAVYR